MEFDQVIMLVKEVSASALTQFTIEEGNMKISMKKEKQNIVVEEAVVPGIRGGQETQEKEVLSEGDTVVSPLVGVFYSAGAPDAEPFIKVGDAVSKGQIIGIVEAMKLMNEIESDYDGIVKEVLVDNEQPVEYGQPLFVIG